VTFYLEESLRNLDRVNAQYVATCEAPNVRVSELRFLENIEFLTVDPFVAHVVEVDVLEGRRFSLLRFRTDYQKELKTK
jgi:hypothetical protein